MNGNLIDTGLRRPTWSTIGSDVRKCTDIGSVLQKAHLDYEVVKRPVYTRLNRRRVEVPDRYITVRKDGSKIYDVVSEGYTVVQNRDAFDFVSYMGSDLEFEKAGETAGGMVYIIGKLPDVNILGDGFTPHVIFSNGFDGGFSIRAAICPLRIICQNQFNFAFKDAENTVSIRHTKKVKEKMKEAMCVLQTSADYMQRLNRMAEGYASMKISPRQINMVMDAMFPVTPGASPESLARLAVKKEKFVETFNRAYDSADNYVFRGTAWGLVNAYTDFLTHDPVKGRATDDSRFQRVTFGGDMNRFVKLIGEVHAA